MLDSGFTANSGCNQKDVFQNLLAAASCLFFTDCGLSFLSC